jgi:hypothetical protein
VPSVAEIFAGLTGAGTAAARRRRSARRCNEAERVARLLFSLFRRNRSLGTSPRLAWVNGQPGAAGYDPAGRVFTVLELEMADGMVQAIRAVINPDRGR